MSGSESGANRPHLFQCANQWGIFMKGYGRLALLIPALALALAGCVDFNLTVTLERGEQWTATMDIVFERDAFQAFSSEDLDLSEMEADLDNAVAEIEEDYGDQGVTASWSVLDLEDENEVGYQLTMSGQGYDLLNEIVFDDKAQITTRQEGARRVVDFRLAPAEGDLRSDFFGELDADLLALMDISYTFTLEGGEIIETNGRIVGESKVVWRNEMGPYEATLTEKSIGPEPWVIVLIAVLCLGLLAVIVIAGGIGAYFLLRKRNPPAPEAV